MKESEELVLVDNIVGQATNLEVWGYNTSVHRLLNIVKLAFLTYFGPIM